MPVVRYFIFAGSILFALLLFADWYFPGSAVASRADDVDRSILRITSDHRWPERIVIDTSQPTIVPPAAVTENAPAARDSREAFATMIAPPLSSAAVAPRSSGIGIKAERQRKPKFARRVLPVPVEGVQQAYARDTVAGGW